MDWNKLKIFYIVAENENLLAASQVLHLSPSSISRHIRHLEDSFKTPLFYRYAQGMVLTEYGEILFQTVQKMFSSLVFAQNMLTRKSSTDSLKMMCSSLVPPQEFIPYVIPFLEKFPYVSLSIQWSEEKKSPNFQDTDIIFSSTPVFYAGLSCHLALSQPMGIFASRTYLQKHRVPFKPVHLNDHRLLCLETCPEEKNTQFLLELGALTASLRRPFLTVNTYKGLEKAVEKGLGIGLLKLSILQGEKNILQILPESPCPSLEIYMIYPEKTQNPFLKAFCASILEERAPHALI